MDTKTILWKAVACDHKKLILQAQNHYQDGIQNLIDLMNASKNKESRLYFIERISDYYNRVIKIDQRLNAHKQSGLLSGFIPIEENSIGNSYSSLFGRYFTDDVQEILLEEPCLIEKYHFYNLIKCLEMIIKNCPNLRYLRIVTKPDIGKSDRQLSILERLKANLWEYNVLMCVRFVPNLTDRQIILNNGFIIKLSCGLHIYKAVNSKFVIGACDYDFRKCINCEIEIYKTNPMFK